MKTFLTSIVFSTRGDCDVIDLSSPLDDCIDESGVREGLVTVFCPGATGGITTVEYESGCVQDLKDWFRIQAPERGVDDGEWAHNRITGDGNAHSHLRAALVGPSVTIPVRGGAMVLGTWQSPVFVDFDNRPRNRELAVTIIGEEAN